MDDTRSAQSVCGQDEQKLYNDLISAVYVVLIQTEGGFGSGTGFCVDPNGLIMTCAHCVPGKFCRVARYNGTYQKALLLHKVDAWDIAILCLEEGLKKKDNIPNDYPVVQLAKDGNLNPGQAVYSISHQHSLMYSFSSGKISYPCKDDVISLGMLLSKSSGKELAKDIPSATSEYRTHREISTNVNVHEDLPVIKISNIHLGHGASGGPIFLPTKEVVGMLYSGSLSRSYAVHVVALQIAFEAAKKIYEKLVIKLAANVDEQLRQKSADVTKSNDN